MDDRSGMTFGERLVGLTYVHSGDSEVTACKASFALLLDQLNDLRNATVNAEVRRLATVAIQETQTAQMWAVRALSRR